MKLGPSETSRHGSSGCHAVNPALVDGFTWTNTVGRP